MSDEALHEALLELQQARLREQTQREETERLLEGLAILTSATSTDEIFTRLLEVCREALRFEHACVIRTPPNGRLVVEAATHRGLETMNWSAQALSEPPDHRRVQAFYDVEGVSPWSEDKAMLGVARAALHVDLRDEQRWAMLICVHSRRGFFGPGQIRIATRMAPLFAQALRAAAAFELEKSAQRRTQDKLRETASRLSALIENMRAGVLVEDAQGRVAFANSAFCRIFDIEALPESLEDMPCEALAAACSHILVDPEAVTKRVQALMQGGEPSVGERIELRDGRVLERDHLPITQDGLHVGTLWQYMDVTEHLETQDSLRQAKELAEAASAAKTSFLATLSHEIRTPLNAILGMTALTLGSQLNPEQRGYLRSIRTNSESLLHLLSDILDFTKIESGKMELEHMPFDIVAQVEEVAEVLAERASAKGLELVVDISEHMPTRILGDPNRTRQVLMNLLGNAIKYTEQGHVVIRVKGSKQSKDQIRACIEVEDTGIGMNPATLRRIFDRFYRGQTNDIEGTGLGLSISDNLVRLMGGSLTATSRLGEGSIFTVDVAWPVARREHPQRSSVREVMHGLGVIVAVPQSVALAPLQRLLQMLDMRVRVAVDQAQMQVLLKTFPEDILVVDERFWTRSMATSRRGILVLQTVGAPWTGDLGADTERINKPTTRRSLWDALMRLTGESNHAPQTADLMTVAVDGGANILLVEDNLDNQKVTAAILRRAGHRVVVAGDATAGVRAALGESFDLVLMDIDLPGRSGVEATVQIRAHRPREALCILAFTAHATEDMRKACETAGMDGFLAKPVAARTLLDTVSHWLPDRPVPRVLVVDDAVDSRTLVLRFLAGLDLRVREADSGSKALAAALGGELDLLVMDIEMPGMDGIEVLKRIRCEPATRELPVLLVSGHSPRDLKGRGLPEQGPTAYIMKPVRKIELMDSVLTLLQRGPSEPRPELDDAILELRPNYIVRSLTALDDAADKLSDGQCVAALRIGHQLKGTGTSFGLPLVSDYGADLERFAQQADLQACIAGVEKLRSLLIQYE